MKFFLSFIMISICNIAYSQKAPEDAIYPTQFIRSGYERLSNDFPIPAAWFQAATIKYDEPNDGYIKIDYFRFFEIDFNGNKNIVDENDYNYYQEYIPSFEGALYSRIPSENNFCKKLMEDMDNAYIDGNNLVVKAGERGDRVSHWWSEKRVNGSIGYTYGVEVRFLVHGNVALQIGCDFYNITKTDNMNPEPWVSHWFGDTHGEYRTEIVPVYGVNEKFAYGVDYGVTTKGKFFVSKALTDYLGGTNGLQLKSDYSAPGWEDTPMQLIGDRWIYESEKKLDKNKKVLFCFRFNPISGKYLPHMLIDNGMIDDMNNVKPNINQGYNFYLYPVEE